MLWLDNFNKNILTNASNSICWQLDTKECSSSLCSDNGECLQLADGSIRCICEYGYTSDNCADGELNFGWNEQQN